MSTLPRHALEKREAVAILLWQRFAPTHHIEWADESHKAEYRDAADGVLALLTDGSASDRVIDAPEPSTGRLANTKSPSLPDGRAG